MSYRIYDASAFGAAIDSHEEAIVTDINTNPGTDLAGIVLRTAKSQTVVEEVLAVLEERRIVTRAYDTSGVPFLWTAGAFATAIWNQRAAARTWLAANNGKTVQQMATALGVHEAIAYALAEGLRSEGKARLIAV
jgi:hypothetical protein